MPTNSSPTTGPDLEALLEQIVFADPDPRVQLVKARWTETQREVQALFETACREQHELRLDYHRTCAAPYAETLALRDLALIRPMRVEEREQRLCLLWQDLYRKVNQVLRDIREEKAQGPNSGPHSTPVV